MKVRVLSALLAFCLVLTMVPAVGALPTGVLDPADPYLVANDVVVITENAVVGSYDTVADAVLLAQDGSTLWLQNNVTEQGSVTVDKAITLDGNEHIISAYENASDAKLILSATGETTLQNVTLTGMDVEVQNGTVNILSGTYHGSVTETSGTLRITGGTFSNDVSAYVPDGYTATANADGTEWTVAVEPEPVVSADPYVVMDDAIADLTEEDRQAIVGVASSVTVDLAENEDLAGELTSAASNAVNGLDEDRAASLMEEGLAQLTGDTAGATLVAQTAIQVTATGYESGVSFSVNIQPVVQYVVTTDPSDIQLSGDSANAVKVGGNPTPVTVNVAVTLTIELPNGFAGADEQVYMNHQVDGVWLSYETTRSGNQITFTTNGFSPFQGTKIGPEASVGGTNYAKLSEVVSSVAKDNDTVTLYKSIDAANPLDLSSVTKTLILTRADDTVTINPDSITVADGYKATLRDDGSVYYAEESAEVPDPDEPVNYTVTVETPVNGTIAITGEGVTDNNDGTYTVPANTEVTVTATADEGYHFSAWWVDGASIDTTDNPYTFAVNADTTIGAVFEADDMPPSQDYLITVVQPDNGTITIEGATDNGDGSYSVAPDALINIYVRPDDGYRVATISANDEAIGTYTETEVFDVYRIMDHPVTEDTTITAEIVEIDAETPDTPDTPSGGGSSGTGGSGRYNISVPSTAHGSISLDRENAAYGTLVTITVRPDAGYELGTLTVTDRNGREVEVTHEGGNEYSFRMPNSRVSIEATFVASGAASTGLPFTDVASSAWYYDAVRFVYENGLMNGVSATSFGPNQTTSRGMIVTILYRLEGEPAVAGSTFSDVASNAYYANAIAWASANGIVNGYGNGTFQPNRAISREEMATILYRYASYKGYSVTTNGSLSGYTDADQVSAYALEAMRWANENNLVTGTTVTTLAPTTGSTRAVAATILMRFINSFAQ